MATVFIGYLLGKFMYAFLVSVVRLFFNTLRWNLRKEDELSIKETKLSYQDSFNITDYKLSVSVIEYSYKVSNPHWYIPDFKRYMYKVNLQKTKGSVCIDEIEAWYPRFASFCIDPHYPLVCAANVHIDRFLPTLKEG